MHSGSSARGVLSLLERRDKWFLGGGRAVVWAPEFPLFLDRLGFWDHACFLNYEVEPIFALTILDESLMEVKLECEERSWDPSRLSQRLAGGGLRVVEAKCLQPEDTLVSELRVEDTSGRERALRLVQWTCQPTGEDAPGQTFLRDVRPLERGLVFEKQVNREDGKPLMRYSVAMGSSVKPSSRCVNISENAVNHPRWALTPFYEKMAAEGLPGEWRDAGGPEARRWRALLYMGLEYRLRVEPGSAARFSAGAAIGKDGLTASKSFASTLGKGSLEERSRGSWEAFFSSVPSFCCSDPYLETAYWYRWYGLRLNMVDVRDYTLPYPCVYEGVNAGWFRHNISYSAQCHMLECRWMHSPEVAQGSLLNFIANQRSDGSFPGGIRTGFNVESTGFYHANWGNGVRQLFRVHPDRSFLDRVYEPMVKYAQYMSRERDREGSHLYDVVNQGETGQEYMSRYLFVNENADHWVPIQLKGVDSTVYVYELQRNLAWTALQLGREAEAQAWRGEAERTKRAVLEKMWDGEKEFFFDVNPRGWGRSHVKAAVCFYPFMTDIAGREHLGVVTRHLLNPGEFWTPYPVPSTSMDDDYFSAYGEWRGRRHCCPWNGRSWLMTGSHVCEALAEASINLDEGLRPKAAEMMRNFIGMTFLDGDARRPSSYEYYNPFNGKAPIFRGVDDYMHSWLADLIIKYVAGVRPGDGDKVRIDPLPFNLAHFALDNLLVKGRRMRVVWRREKVDGEEPGLSVYVDGRLAEHSPVLTRFELTLV